MPAAAVTACCSAMPTSMRRSGNRSANGSSPVESGIAAVIATSSGRASASLMTASLNAAVYDPGFRSDRSCMFLTGSFSAGA